MIDRALRVLHIMIVCVHVCVSLIYCVRVTDHTPVDCGFCGIVFISFMKFSWCPSDAVIIIIPLVYMPHKVHTH